MWRSIIFMILLMSMSFGVIAARNINKRFVALTKEIRCVACLNQSIADSEAPLAADLRKKINSMMLAGDSDEQIKQYLVSRYGEFILLNPKWQPSTWVLWLFPWLGMLIAGVMIVCCLRHRHR